MKKVFLSVLTLALLMPMLGSLVPTAETYDHSETFAVTAVDATMSSTGVIIYPNNTDAPRVIGAADYNFRHAKLMIFDKNGVLIEAGGELLANEDGTFGSPQLTVTIPPRGFMLAFGYSAPKGLFTCINTAMENAMLYNATMSIVYPMYGSYDASSARVTVSYDDPVAPSKDAPKFLFVGNSTTYFNGTPIKFKAICEAAGKEVIVDYCTFGSAYLSEFADATHERGKAFRNKLNSTKYDYIVLQDAASADYYKSKAAMDILMPLIEKNGAQALLYMRYSTGDAGTQRHYGNYPKLSKDFGDLPVANVTGSFNLCRELYPDINLLADDGGHHSCEGSYLIACTWLYAYLGIDPRGNTYTANLPEGTVAALQECAYKISEMGLELPGKDLSYELDGVKYPLVSKDKPYTVNGSSYSGDWTDTGADGKPLGKRTDGVFASAGDEAAVGCWKGADTSITINLGKNHDVKIVYTDLWGNTWGIPDPRTASVDVEVSTDGEEFVSVGSAVRVEQTANGAWKKCDFTLVLEQAAKARYVRVTYHINGNFCWSSEAAVYGTESQQEDPQPAKRGDVNLDGKIDAKDYMMLKRAILGTHTLKEEQLFGADVNGDGARNARDYLMLKRHVLGTFVIPE